MVVPSRDVVVRFSPVDVTVLPPEYQITSAPAATIVRITTNIMRFIRPPVLLLALLVHNLCLQPSSLPTSLWEDRQQGFPEFAPCRHRHASGASRRDPSWSHPQSLLSASSSSPPR